MHHKLLLGVVPAIFASLTLGGCTSDPYAPINQTTPIRQMDNAFDPTGSRYYERTPTAPPAYPRPSPYYDTSPAPRY